MRGYKLLCETFRQYMETFATQRNGGNPYAVTSCCARHLGSTWKLLQHRMMGVIDTRGKPNATPAHETCWLIYGEYVCTYRPIQLKVFCSDV